MEQQSELDLNWDRNINLIKKVSSKDIKDWQSFISNKQPLEDKDQQSAVNKSAPKIKKIDLHGFSLNEANKFIENFINKSFEEKVEKIIVITGKGLRSKSAQDPYVSKDLSKLRYSVPEYINNSSDLKNKIKKISKAEIIDGGEGAFYVFLKN